MATCWLQLASLHSWKTWLSLCFPEQTLVPGVTYEWWPQESSILSEWMASALSSSARLCPLTELFTQLVRHTNIQHKRNLSLRIGRANLEFGGQRIELVWLCDTCHKAGRRTFVFEIKSSCVFSAITLEASRFMNLSQNSQPNVKICCWIKKKNLILKILSISLADLFHSFSSSLAQKLSVALFTFYMMTLAGSSSKIFYYTNE